MTARWGAPLALAAARLRRHPGRWLLPAAGLALAVAAGAAVIGEGTIAGDQAARRDLRAVSRAARTARLTWSGGLTGGEERRARRLLAGRGGRAPARGGPLRPPRDGRGGLEGVAGPPPAACAPRA